jgi:hypothetical protein
METILILFLMSFCLAAVTGMVVSFGTDESL